MDFTKLSIKRPITILMVSLIVVLLGGVSLSQMKLDLMPSMDVPIAMVMTTYSGAGPEEVENIVTKPMEGAVANVEGAKNIMSVSSEGTSVVMIEFADGTNMDNATLWVRERIDLVKGFFPSEVGAPMVMKMDMNAQPIAYITMTSGQLEEDELKAFVDDKIVSRLESLTGVASVEVMGGTEKEITVELDMERMEGLGIDMNSVSQVLAAENMNQAGGSVNYGDKSFNISSKMQLKGIEDIKNVPITLPTGGIVRLQDISNIAETHKDVQNITRVNNQPCLLISISKSSDSNTVTAVNNVKKELTKINTDYKEIDSEMLADQAEFIQLAIDGVTQNLLLGGILAVIILFIFLKNIGLTGVIAVSMPLSVIATFVLLYFSGTTLNMISLGGLALGIGMLVDNSVVVIESIYRYRKEGCDMVEGTYLGTKEVRTAVVASTLTTVVVFLPIVFASGIVMDMFKDMAMSVVFSLLASLVVALTVVPMLCGNLVHNIHRNRAPKQLNFINKILSGFDLGIKQLTAFYKVVLAYCIKRRKRTLALVLVLFIGSMMLVPSVGMELIPASDEGNINIEVRTPDGSNLEELNRLSSKVEAYLITIPEMSKVTVQLGGGTTMGSSATSASLMCELMPKQERDKATADIADMIRKETKNIPGAEISVSSASSVMGGSSFGGGGISLEVRGPELDVLKNIGDELMRQIGMLEGTREISSSMDDAAKQVAIRIDREKASQYGLIGAQVSANIRTAIEGKVATTVKANGTEIDVRLKYPNNVVSDVKDLAYITIKSPYGGYIPLGSLAEITIEEAPINISRQNQERYVTIGAEIYGRDTGSVSSEVDGIIANMTLPVGYSINQGGQVEMMVDSFNIMVMVIIMAILLVYMVMAAQFESLLYPFIIMFTMPLAFTGSIVLLFLTGEPLSVPGAIGFVILVGIVVNNGIVLVDYINTLRKRDGMNVNEAIMAAGPTRLRPILMTALTTILALIPIMLSQADGAEMQRGLGLVVAGGLTTSTMLTLVVVPILYIYFDRVANKFKRMMTPKKKRKALEGGSGNEANK